MIPRIYRRLTHEWGEDLPVFSKQGKTGFLPGTPKSPVKWGADG